MEKIIECSSIDDYALLSKAQASSTNVPCSPNQSFFILESFGKQNTSSNIHTNYHMNFRKKSYKFGLNLSASVRKSIDYLYDDEDFLGISLQQRNNFSDSTKCMNIPKIVGKTSEEKVYQSLTQKSKNMKPKTLGGIDINKPISLLQQPIEINLVSEYYKVSGSPLRFRQQKIPKKRRNQQIKQKKQKEKTIEDDQKKENTMAIKSLQDCKLDESINLL